VEKVCVSPGNHDSYVPGAFSKARKAWDGYMQGETLDDHQFPFVRRIGDVAVISCSSSVSTPPWLAAGTFSARQAARLSECLRRLGEEGLFRVVLIHHPPNIEARHWRLGLWGGRRFRAVIAEHGAELILHGHTHKSSMHTMPGPKGEVPVVGVTSAAAAPGGIVDDPARYNLFRIERNEAGWSCTMREYGFQRTGTDIIMRLQMKIY
jgi:3',5'-cyclic AMP phosphodiesterase CpdA